MLGVVGLMLFPGLAEGDGSGSAGQPSAEAPGASSSLGGPLATPGSPTEGEQVQAGEEASRSNPEAVTTREESRTKYEDLSTEGALKVDGEAFPTMIDDPAGGPPRLPAGQRITGFAASNVAQTELGEGQSGVIESTVPMALPSSPGQWAPIDLGLSEADGSFRQANPLVEVGIPKRLADGVQLGQLGVSLTPVDGSGASLGGSEGVLDGSVVLYANTQTDTDTVIKPTTFGFDAIGLLRSAKSTQQLDYRVGLPQGASLVQEAVTGAVRIVKEGATIGMIVPPSAHDAVEVPVPVKMSLSGDTIEIKVEDSSSNYDYPIEVDPGVNELSYKLVLGNWVPGESTGAGYTLFTGVDTLWIAREGGHGPSLQGDWKMQTNGDSKIYKIHAETDDTPGGYESDGIYYENNQNRLEFIGESKTENYAILTPRRKYGEYENERRSTTLCANTECSPEKVAGHNIASFVDNTMSTVEYEDFYDEMEAATLYISQPKETHSTVSYNTHAETLDGTANVLYGSGAWFGPHNGALEYTTEDNGLGVAQNEFEYEGEEGWTGLYNKTFLSEERACKGVECEKSESEVLTYKSGSLALLPNGEDHVRAAADDDEPDSWSREHGEGEIVLKVDSTPPHGLTLTGLPENGELNEKAYKLSAQATDGSGKTPSSGIKSIALTFDGQEVTGGISGSCKPGPCTANGEWTINGESLGAGKGTLTVIATDNAGNVEKKPYAVTVRHTTSLPVGPGSVNPISGQLSLSASDVDLSGGSGTLAVTREYDSRDLTTGAKGPLGPQWTVGLGSEAKLEVLEDGSVMVVGPEGLSHFAVKEGGGFEAPEGDSNLTLEAKETEKKVTEYLLKNPAKGTTTRFTLPSGSQVWMPTVSEGPIATDTTTYEYKTAEVAGEKIIEPTFEIAPHASASCAREKMEKGCRGLEFTYATKTTATESEWGEYNGRLMTVSAVLYNSTTGKEATTPVAQYAYDGQGRLRTEWDPRISPALKTIYGYDSEGHVTVESHAGQQPWLFRYGTIAGDTNAGRLLSVTRPPASTELSTGSSPSGTTGPSLSTESPTIGVTLSASNGGWTNKPLLYSFQWEDCSTLEGCVPIPGANNRTYTPVPHDAGYLLLAKVTATNATGTSESAVSNAKLVALTAPKYSWKFGEAGVGAGQFEGPTSDAIDGSGNVWVVDHNNSRVQELSSTGTFVKALGWGVKDGKAEFEICTSNCHAGIAGPGNGQFSKPEEIAINHETGNLYVADRGNNRIEEFKSNGEFVRAFGEYGSARGQLNAPDGIGIDPKGNVWVGDYYNNRVDEFTEEGVYIGSFGSTGEGPGQFKGPDGIVFSNNHAYVVDVGNNRVQEFSLSGTFINDFGSKGSENGQFSSPYGIAVDAVSGDLYVGDYGNDRIEEFNPAGTFLETFGKKGSGNGELLGPETAAVNAQGDIYVPDAGNDRIQEFEPTYSTNNPALEAPIGNPYAVSTIEYNVPLYGSGLPPLSSKEFLEFWGQKDDPVEATAIFPPDEPMGWPAKNYERATIYYRDLNGRTVNVERPGGGVSTTEYNENNEVTRTLSPDNRAAVLEEGTKSTELSELLDTKSKYNGEILEERIKEEKEGGPPPGTRLTETVGPQHSVKRASGGEATMARNHVKYYYDEGAPKGETYNLVTKTVDWGETATKEEFDKRTTTTSYNGAENAVGQENIGWKLREPTAVTAEPSGLKLTTTTVYEPSTGAVVETRSPADPSGESTPPEYLSQFGSEGVEEGEFKNPAGVAVDSSGDLWVADDLNHRVDEFSSASKFIEAIGWGVSNGKAEFEICKASCKTGLRGSGTGEFSEPIAIAINQSSGNAYIIDRGNDCVAELNSKGEYVRTFGKKGSEHGELANPSGIAIDASGNVWVADSGNNRVQEFSAEGVFKASYGSYGSGEDQFHTPVGIAFSNGNMYIVDQGNNRIEEMSTEGEYLGQLGSKGTGNGQFATPSGIAVDPASGDLYIADTGNSRIEELAPTGTYLDQFGSKGNGNGQFNGAEGVAVSSSGDVYVADNGNARVQEFGPPRTFEPTTDAGFKAAHDTRTIYYTAKANPQAANCGGRIEWENLPCETQPVAQPELNVPSVPVKTIVSYNMWDEPETTTETVGSTTKTTKETFDSAGRGLTREVSSSVGIASPKVTDKYNEATGALEKESTTTEGKEETITSIYNTLGELKSYTDADANTTLYEYDIDGRVKGIDYGLAETGEQEAQQHYEYNHTTGYLSEIVDEAAGTFTATYDLEGNILTEGYPNNMTAKYSYNSTGEKTGIEYVKGAHCGETCKWFTDTIIPSIHGETLKQVSTLATEEYKYDTIGRLAETQETPTGKPCTKRAYTYDLDSNRTSLTTGECSVEGGKSESYLYDTANRLANPGTEYNTFGDTTKVPSVGAGGSELTNTYYGDNQTASETQNGEKIEYKTDPAGRTRETISSGATASTAISHYAGPGEVPSWTSEESGGKWSRNITGIDGALTAIEHRGETPVLQLHDLQGNIVATAALSETETKLLSSYNSTEFGVPTTTKPPKYSWLGAGDVAAELPSGIIAQNGLSYVPELGRTLQTEGITIPTPVNISSLFVSTVEPWVEGVIAASSAHLLALSEAAKKAEEAAHKPSGNVPTPECDIETEGCAADPEHGKNEFGCSLKGSWGVEIEVNVELNCHVTPSASQIEVEIWIVEDDQYIKVKQKGRTWSWERNSSYELGLSSCEPGKWYRAWVYGRVWAFSVFVWSDAYVLGDNKKCYVQGDLIPPGESGIEGNETPQPPDQ
jgi:YD repeat-containing protein